MKHVLVVEDDVKIASFLREYLLKAGFRVSTIDNGNMVVSFVKENEPDAILLDIILPDGSGMDLCRDIRSFSAVPILMITARVDVADRILGLELGADDYICKPFSPREVVARVKAILRRSHKRGKDQSIKSGILELDPDTRLLSVKGHRLYLTPIEYDLMRLMLERPNRVFTRNELINQVLGVEYDGFDRTIDAHIKNLRHKITSVLPGIQFIHSVYGVGYKFSDIDNNN